MGHAEALWGGGGGGGGLGRGLKVKYHQISSTKSITKNFIPNFVSILTHKRYKTYRTGCSFCHLGYAPGIGLGGAMGGGGGGDEKNRVKVQFSPYPYGKAVFVRISDEYAANILRTALFTVIVCFIFTSCHENTQRTKLF